MIGLPLGKGVVAEVLDGAPANVTEIKSNSTVCHGLAGDIEPFVIS